MMELSNKTALFGTEIVEKIAADYEEFQGYQVITQKILAQFHKICEDNGIWYYLAYGSLLGAIRDNGQIPWDYDIDVWVPYEHAKKLIDALEKELPKEYYFVTRLYDSSARHNIMRITPVGYDSEVLHLDVFWLGGLVVDSTQREAIRRKVDNSTRAMQIKHCAKELLGVSGKVSTIKYMLERFLYAFYADRNADRLFHSTMHACEGCEKLTDNFYVLEFKSEWFGAPQVVIMENGQPVCIPCDSDAILTLRYGNYMEVPPVDSRMAEFQRALDRIRKFAVKKAD